MNVYRKFHLEFFLILLVFILAFVLRFTNISNIPNGLYPDETAIGYNAYSILTTGKDEYGVKLPLYFRSFDDYKMPVYIYSTALAIKAFGADAFAIRVTSALFGSLAVIALYFLILELSRKRSFAFIAALFLAFNPWQFFFSRAGYEVNVATSLLVIGILFFVMAVNRKNNFLLFILSIIAFIIALYTYNVTRIISPLIFFSLVILYFKKITVNSKKLLISLGLLYLIGMIPFIVTYLPLQSQPGFASQQDALITGKIAKAEILQTRSYFSGLPEFLQKIFFNYWLLLLFKLFKNAVSFFSTNFFFTIGADHPFENIGGGFGMFYYFDFPLIIFGLYQAFRKRVAFLLPFFIWFLFMFFVGSIIVAIPKMDAFGTRAYSVVIPFVVFSAYGFYSLFEMLKEKRKVIKATAVIIAALVIGYSYLFYFTSYFVRFPVEYAKEWHSEDKPTVEYIMSIQDKYKKIVFDDSANFNYTYLLFYGKYPAELHQKEATYVPSGLVDTVSKDGKFEFKKVNWDKEMKDPGILFITSKDNVPSNKAPLKTFNYPTRPVVLYYDRKIAQYPTTDTAYEIFESGK